LAGRYVIKFRKKPNELNQKAGSEMALFFSVLD